MKIRIIKKPNTFAQGGLVLGGYHTNGADWELPGNMRIFNTGSTHELNGNQGIQLGIDPLGNPNVVEENETVYNDYVFSNRLTVPTKKELDEELKNLPENEGGESLRGWEISVLKKYAGKTYADASKAANKEMAENPNDPILKRGLEVVLGVLANSQEKIRAKQENIEANEQLDSISDLEFAELKLAEELLAELQLQMQELLMQLQLLEQVELGLLIPQTAEEVLLELVLEEPLMTPEELQLLAQLIAMLLAQLALVSALGGNMHAYGGSFYDNGGQIDLQRYQLIFQQIADYANLNKKDQPELYLAVRNVKTPLDMMSFVTQFLEAQLKAQQVQQNELAISQQVNAFAAGSKLPPVNIEDLTVGNTRSKLNDTIGTARLEHSTLFGNNINAFFDNKISAINEAIANGDYATARTLRNDLIKEWNNINEAYSKMNPNDKASVRALLEAFNNAGLNANLDNILSNSNIVTRGTGKAYTHDNPLDEILGVVTANRYLDSTILNDDNLKAMKALGINSNIWGDNPNQDYYHRLDAGLNTLDVMINPEYTKFMQLNPDERVNMTQPEKYIPVLDWLNTEGTPFYNKENPVVWDNLTPEQKEAFTWIGDADKDINTKYRIWGIGESNPQSAAEAALSIQLQIDNSTTPPTSSTSPTDTNTNIVDPFPKPSTWPLLAGLGLLAGTTLYNALKPIDYSNADAMIEASKAAGSFEPIDFRPIGDYLTYRPLDRNYEGNKVLALMAALRRALSNTSGGNRSQAGANMLASDYNLINQLGAVDRQAAEANRAHEALVAEFNRGTNQFNSQGFLLADEANQTARARAANAALTGLAHGYQMRDLLQQNKANAISAGISGIGNLLYNYAQLLDLNRLLKYAMDHNLMGYVDSSEYGLKNKSKIPSLATTATSTSSKNDGKLTTKRRKRNKGLSF